MGALDWMAENIPGVAAASEAVSDVGSGVAEYVSPALDVVGGGVSAAVDAVSPGLDHLATGVGGMVDDGPSGALPELRDSLDYWGNNLMGYGVDFSSKLLPSSGTLGALGKGLAPIAALSGLLGMYDDTRNLDDPAPGESNGVFDPNSYLANVTGFLGGGASTLSALGGTLGLHPAMAASLGSTGSVIGAGAAGLTGGHYLAKFADSEYGKGPYGETTYDDNTRAAIAVQQWVNPDDDPDALLGKIAGGATAAVGGVPAGLIGGARAAVNVFSGLF